MAFVKAAKRKLKARVALCGPTGAGKTWTGLQLLRSLVGAEGKIAVIDTENKTASKYLGDAIDDFDVDEFESFELERYIKSIDQAAAEGYDGLLIDSLTHAWSGRGGALEKVDAVAAAQAAKGWGGGKKDNFSAWREVTPLHNKLVETMVRFPGHLVVTMRAKMEYEKVDGKVVKLGMAPIQRDGLEYEFDVVCDIDVNHSLVVSKTRCKALDGKLFKKPDGSDLAKPLLAWLNDGAEEAPKPAPQPSTDPGKTGIANPAVYLMAKKALHESGLTPEQWQAKAREAGVDKPAKDYTKQDLEAVLAVVSGSKDVQNGAANG